jgi:hypothetical protein
VTDGAAHVRDAAHIAAVVGRGVAGARLLDGRFDGAPGGVTVTSAVTAVITLTATTVAAATPVVPLAIVALAVVAVAIVPVAVPAAVVVPAAMVVSARRDGGDRQERRGREGEQQSQPHGDLPGV